MKNFFYQDYEMNLTEFDPGAKSIALPRQVLDHEVAASIFVENYQHAWRIWRDTPELHALNPAAAYAFDKAFTAADC